MGVDSERLIRLQHHSTKVCICRELSQKVPPEIIEMIQGIPFNRCRLKEYDMEED